MICNLKFLGFTLEKYKKSCHFDVVLFAIYKVYYRKKSDDSSQVQII